MLKFGIIGCGVIAPLHVKAIKEAGNQASLYAVCDIIEDRAKKFLSDHGAKKHYVNYFDMLNDKEVDVVCICTPSGMHGEMAIECAKHGKHILCEKPMEITTEKLDKLENEISKYPNIKMGCVFQRRTQEIAVKVKKAIDDGIFGKLVMGSAYLKMYRSADYYKSADWRATWEWDGGGALMNQGVHGVDLLNWFMGGATSVSAVAKTIVHDIKVEDTAVAVLRFGSGAVGTIECTTSVYPAQDTRFEIHFEKGSIIFTDKGISLWGTQEISGSTVPDGPSIKDNPAALGSLSHTPILLDLINAINNNRQPMVGPKEGRKAVDLVLAIYKSSKTRKEVKL